MIETRELGVRVRNVLYHLKDVGERQVAEQYALKFPQMTPDQVARQVIDDRKEIQFTQRGEDILASVRGLMIAEALQSGGHYWRDGKEEETNHD